MTTVPQHYPASELGCDPADYEQWLFEVRHFQSIRDELLANDAFNGKFIAIRRDQIVDTDADEFVLARRIEKRFPREVVLVTKVEPESQKLVELPSTEMA